MTYIGALAGHFASMEDKHSAAIHLQALATMMSTIASVGPSAPLLQQQPPPPPQPEQQTSVPSSDSTTTLLSTVIEEGESYCSMVQCSTVTDGCRF